jgi:SNF2 family DNA or RNA helicase
VDRALLGDEMGLGKTIQALAAIGHAMSREGQTRHVVLCPAALIDNWLAEITKTMPSVAKWRFDGSERPAAYRGWRSHGGILLSSYDQAEHLLDADPPRFGFLVADEAHWVKNPKTKRSERTAGLTRYAHRVLLMGGTLLENRASELIELVDLADPERGQQLRAVFGDGRDAHQQPDLFRRELSNVYLRRNKGEVLEELPDLLKADIPVSISPRGNAAYVEAIKRRKLAQARIALAIGDGTDSPKMRVLKEIVDDCRAEGNRTLIFSEFRAVLDTAARVVGKDCAVVHGDVPQAKRSDIIERFQETNGFAALVMQIRVGGVGLNLQAASVVVLLEPQYKPSTEEQAIGRAHRLGQHKAVTAYRLVAQDSVEKRIVALTALKEDLFDELAGRSDLAESSPQAHDRRLTDDQLLDDEWRRLGLGDSPDDEA